MSLLRDPRASFASFDLRSADPARGVQPRHLPSPAFLPVRALASTLRRPRRLSPRRASRAASQRPGALLRFRLQGLLPPRGSAPLSRRPALLRVGLAGRAAKRNPRDPAPELRSPREIRTSAGRNPSEADALLTFALQGSPPPRAAPGFPGAAPVRFRGRSCDRPPALRSFSPSGAGVSSLPRRRPSWASSPSREPPLRGAPVSVAGSAYRLNPTLGILRPPRSGFLHRACG